MGLRFGRLRLFELYQRVGTVDRASEKGVSAPGQERNERYAKNQVLCVTQYIHEAGQVDFLIVARHTGGVGARACEDRAGRQWLVRNEGGISIHGVTFHRVMARAV